ncbi:MgtC/SapB family protein [Salinicola sp. JS01]|uniref:MgtC/SapB family protein n=1 Tax=Salinicola sp. JS01 TaxID=3050071 RepID=UPI00255C1EDE|nr:MgtC/SapB family protein [Salinicola sp. JS01]WIX31359.1 MgtC/SapB family protein [Salinicola sp. JS01]
MSAVSATILTYPGMAWLVGSLIGLERTFHGRPAGLRTRAGDRLGRLRVHLRGLSTLCEFQPASAGDS